MLKPNILFICCDQQRWDCVGFQHQYPVHTPYLDKLFEEGICFDNSFTPLPSCCPARQALLCGKRPEKIGALWNYDQGIPVASVAKEAFSWAKVLKDHGYRTGYVGKWHVSPKLTPLDFGYEDYISYEALVQKERNLHPEIHPDYSHGAFGDISPYPYEESATHLNAEEVIRLMDKYEGGPWHIKMDFSEPHLPCRPSEPFASMYDSVPKWRSFDDPIEDKPYIQKQMRKNWKTDALEWKDLEDTVKYYYGYISQIDDAVGRVLAHLEETGQAENTMVIYTADHGDLCGDRHMLDKHYVMYDEVVRVPLVIRLPGTKLHGIHSRALVVNMLDLVPTILEAAGCAVPDDLDGISLYPIISGEQEDIGRNYVLSTYNGQQFGLYVQRMIRNETFKYIWNPTDVDELYDLKQDPSEMHNCVHDAAYAEILRNLRLDLIKELEAAGDFTIKSPWLKKQLAENNKI